MSKTLSSEFLLGHVIALTYAVNSCIKHHPKEQSVLNEIATQLNALSISVLEKGAKDTTLLSHWRKPYELVIRDSTSAPCVNGWRFDTKQSGDGSSTAERIYEFVWIHGNAADGRQLLGILGLANHAVNSFSYFLGC